jgi:hypothetical protein
VGNQRGNLGFTDTRSAANNHNRALIRIALQRRDQQFQQLWENDSGLLDVLRTNLDLIAGHIARRYFVSIPYFLWNPGLFLSDLIGYGGFIAAHRRASMTNPVKPAKRKLPFCLLGQLPRLIFWLRKSAMLAETQLRVLAPDSRQALDSCR